MTGARGRSRELLRLYSLSLSVSSPTILCPTLWRYLDNAASAKVEWREAYSRRTSRRPWAVGFGQFARASKGGHRTPVDILVTHDIHYNIPLCSLLFYISRFLFYLPLPRHSNNMACMEAYVILPRLDTHTHTRIYAREGDAARGRFDFAAAVCAKILQLGVYFQGLCRPYKR